VDSAALSLNSIASVVNKTPDRRRDSLAVYVGYLRVRHSCRLPPIFGGFRIIVIIVNECYCIISIGQMP